MASSLVQRWRQRPIIRSDRWRYMLIFPLSPMFLGIRDTVFPGSEFLGTNPLLLLGICYSLGMGIWALPGMLRRGSSICRWLSLLAAETCIGWLVLPSGWWSIPMGMAYAVSYGICAGYDLFAYAFALEQWEQLVGALVIAGFSLAFQLLGTVKVLASFHREMYLAAQTMGTMICMVGYEPGKIPVPHRKRGNFKALALALYFFFAHRLVMFFYNHLPHPNMAPGIMWLGFLVVAVSLLMYLQLSYRFWHLGSVFFMGAVAAYVLRLTLPPPEGEAAADGVLHAGIMGFVASYTMLGYGLNHMGCEECYRRVAAILCGGTLVIHLVPSLIALLQPSALLLTGLGITVVLLGIYVLLAPMACELMTTSTGTDAPSTPPPAPDLADALHHLDLSPRELDVANLLLAGKMYKEIAAELHISQETVKFHARHVYQKLGISGRNELAQRLTAQPDKKE